MSDPAQAAAGEELLASASEAKVEDPKEAKTGEQAAETLKKANSVPDAVVRMAGEVTGRRPREVEISEGEEALGGLLTLLRQARPDPSTVPDIALVDAGQELQAKGVAEGGAIAIDATRAADAMRSTLMHEVQHLSAGPRDGSLWGDRGSSSHGVPPVWLRPRWTGTRRTSRKSSGMSPSAPFPRGLSETLRLPTRALPRVRRTSRRWLRRCFWTPRSPQR